MFTKEEILLAKELAKPEYRNLLAKVLKSTQNHMRVDWDDYRLGQETRASMVAKGKLMQIFSTIDKLAIDKQDISVGE